MPKRATALGRVQPGVAVFVHQARAWCLTETLLFALQASAADAMRGVPLEVLAVWTLWLVGGVGLMLWFRKRSANPRHPSPPRSRVEWPADSD